MSIFPPIIWIRLRAAQKWHLTLPFDTFTSAIRSANTAIDANKTSEMPSYVMCDSIAGTFAGRRFSVMTAANCVCVWITILRNHFIPITKLCDIKTRAATFARSNMPQSPRTPLKLCCRRAFHAPIKNPSLIGFIAAAIKWANSFSLMCFCRFMVGSY